MAADEKVNILLVDDQPAKLLSYEVISASWGKIFSRRGQRRKRSSIF